MPKILQINVSANWGSTGCIAEQINLVALKAGWECYIAYSRVANPSKSTLIQIGTKIDVIMAVIETRIFDKAGLSMRRSTKKLIRQISDIKPDIVHLHNIHGYVLNYKLLFEYLNNTDIKVVWTFHDFWSITGHCYHFAEIDCSLWKTGCHDCPLHRQYPSSLSDFSTRNYNIKKECFSRNNNLHIVAVSNWVAGYIKDSFLRDKDIRVINNGVDTKVFKPTLGYEHPVLKLSDFVILGIASQWGVGKGVDDFFSLSKLLKRDEVIVLVGVTDDIIDKLPSKIIGVKRTNSQQELAAIYTRANVVVSFSSAETFGLTIIEGFACGTPAVVYDNTAPPFLLTDDTGYVVPDKDFVSAYNAIEKIKKFGKYRYTEACLEVAMLKFDKDKCYDEYVQLYNSLI